MVTTAGGYVKLQKGEVVMEKIFLSSLTIENVRHLKDITIPLSNEKLKHLIFTGRNGSGKTSVLEALSHYLDTVITMDRLKEEKRLECYKNELVNIKSGVFLDFNQPVDTIRCCFEKGQFILAYYKAERLFQADIPKHVEKVELKDKYMITEAPRQVFIQYLLDLKVTEALARNNGRYEKADVIKQWFAKFQELLRRVFDDSSLELVFEEDTFSFLIKEKNKEAFDFNSLSSGFAAVLDIVLDIIIRMEKKTNKSFDFNMPGIVLIDEIETHLHLELQKTILDLLITIFPNIQFIMSTHSPFILNSISNVIIYDLEKNIVVKDGLSNIPYGGIVEGYFNSSEMSISLKEKFERYKNLTKKQALSDDDFEEIAELEMFLNEIPDYLALNITTEYQRLKIEFENREDI